MPDKKTASHHEPAESKQGRHEVVVDDPVDDYPERPMSEARGSNISFDPSIEQERKDNLFLTHKVGEKGNPESSVFHVANGVKHFGELPHTDYVEDTAGLHPGYNAPVYD